MSAIREDLAKAIKNQQLVEIYSKGIQDQFSVGLVVAQDAKFVLVESINVDGALDGLVVFRTTTLNRIVTKSDYLRSMNTIVKLAKQRGYYDEWGTDALLRKLKPDKQKQSLLRQILRRSFKRDQVIQVSGKIKKHDDSYTGFIHSYHKHYVEFNYVDMFNLAARPQIAIKLAEIDAVSIHSFETYNATAVIEEFMPGDFH